MNSKLTLALKPALIGLFSFVYTSLHAQLDVGRLMTKGHSATGFGGYFNFAVPVSDADYVTADLGLYVFKADGDGVVLVPMLAGYRHTLDGSGTGVYVEPAAGYNIGGTDFPKMGANGSQLYENGKYVTLKNNGPAAALSVGYLFEFPLTISLRFTHVFVSGDPAQSMASIRFAYALTFGRRDR